jgi:hypothetical protein
LLKSSELAANGLSGAAGEACPNIPPVVVVDSAADPNMFPPNALPVGVPAEAPKEKAEVLDDC